MKNIQYKKKGPYQPKPFYRCLLFSQYASNINFGSVFNFWGNYYSENISRILNRSDEEAFRDDWCVIGQDVNNEPEEESIGVVA